MKRALKNKLMVAAIATLLMVGVAVAQAPQAIPYQAAARNNNGVVFANKSVALRFSVRDATAIGTIVYQETQNAVTNALGLFMVNIGQGNVVTGTFSSINWALNAKFIQVELDTTGTGCCYITIGTQQLMSVPYALYANNGNPVGTVLAYMGTTPPAGWLLCDGAEYSKTQFANLFAVLSNATGGTISGTTFNVPDMRGMFLRGVNGSSSITISGVTQSVDPDADSRLASGPGGTGNKGNAVGSLQYDGFSSHTHIQIPHTHDVQIGKAIGGTLNWVTGANGGLLANGPAIATATTAINQNTGGNETRPRNIYVNYIIKY